MRIVIARALPGESTSMDVYADNLVAALKTVRPDWEIVEIAPDPGLSNGGRRRVLKYWEKFLGYSLRAATAQADVFHIIDHSYGHLSYGLSLTGRPVVVTCHDVINLKLPQTLEKIAAVPEISQAAWRFALGGLAFADHVVAVSENTAKDLLELTGVQSGRVSVIPDGVSEVFRPLASRDAIDQFRLHAGIPPQAVCLLHVGSTLPRKNVSTLLEAVAVLKARGLPVHFLKVGTDFSDEQKERIHTCRLENNVTHLGKVDEHTLVMAYNAADVLLFCSLYEGFGMPVLEAMACGTPVVTSNTSSLGEVAGNAAVLVDPLDVEAIARGVSELALNREYREAIIYKGFKRATLFTWTAAARQLADLYLQKAGNTDRRARLRVTR